MLKTAAATLFCLFTLLSVVHADTPLENSMKRLAKAYKQLNLDLKAPVDASKPDYLALTDTMKTEVQKGRDLVPKKVATIPADQQAAMTAAYQKSMDDLLASIDTLSAAIQAGQWDNARATLTKILDQEKAGHKEFRMKEGAAPAPSANVSPSPIDAGTSAR